MARHTNSPKRLKNPKSTPQARRLIRAALRKYKTTRAAAHALGLATHMQLVKMYRGEIGDTAAMKAALVRSEERARRARNFLPLEQSEGVPPSIVLALWRELKALTKRFESIMPKDDENNSPPA